MHDRPPLVTVVIPTGNRPQLMVRAVRSALHQTIKDLEVVVVVDGPDPATALELKGLQDADPRIRVVLLAQNEGGSDARNAGIDAARGEWVALLDDDNEWLPEKLERQLALGVKSPHRHPVISCKLIAQLEKTGCIWPKVEPTLPVGDYLMNRRGPFGRNACLQTSTLVARKSLFQQCHFTSGRPKHQDLDWVVRASELPGVGVEFAAAPLVIWHVEDDRDSISPTDDWRSSLNWINEMRRYIAPESYSSFVLVRLSASASNQGDWRAFFPLLVSALKDGSPRAIDLVLFLGTWLFSLKARGSTRRILHGIPQKVSTGQVKPLRILVVGQTPPPFCGQTVMIKLLLDGFYRDIELIHVRMYFSKRLGSTGRFELAKVFELFRVVADIYYLRLTKRPPVIYYPPAGPSVVPIIRDIVILGMTRWLFKASVFHFHAGGAAEYSLSMNPVFRWIYRSTLAKPDLAIRTSNRAPQDGKWTHCKEEIVVPNGIPDYAGKVIQRMPLQGEPVKLLLVSFLREDKGVLVAIQAAQELMAGGMNIELTCIGEWDSEELRARAESMIDSRFKSRIKFPGMLTGSEKWNHYRESDIALFPSYFHSETFGIVLLEAMCFSLPVVATKWRGIPDVVDEGNCAILCEPRDVAGCREAIARLVSDPALRNQMGERGRERYLRYFTLEAHRKAMEAALSQLRG